MLTATDMRKVRIFVLERDVERVTRALGRLGAIHLSSSVEEGGGNLAPEELADEVERCRGLRERLDRLALRLDVGDAGDITTDESPTSSLGQIEDAVASLEAEFGARLEGLEAGEQALADTEEILAELAPFRDVHAPLARLSESVFLEIKGGSVGAEGLAGLRAELPAGVLLIPLGRCMGPEGSEMVHVLVLGSRRRRYAMATVLEGHGFEEQPFPAAQGGTPAELYAEAADKRARLEQSIAALQADLRQSGGHRAGELRQARGAVALLVQLYEAERNFGTTWATVVITGWAPAGKVEELSEMVNGVCSRQCVIETAPPNKEDIERGRVPSHTALAGPLAPFRALVHGYGVASYTEIEPTVMFAVTFLLLFGLMFGDLGHGLCLIALGLLIRRKAKRPASGDIGGVVAAAGAASALFGTFFQGLFFGKSLADAGFPLTLGFEPIRLAGDGADAAEHVIRYLVLALGFGIALISLGTVLNIINRLRNRDYEDGLLGRFGLVGIVFYWGVIGLSIKLAVAGKGAADVWLAAVLVALPLAILILHRPLHALLARREAAERESTVMGLFEGLIEAMEMVMAYLANTFSFLRVAAFAFSHAALCFTIFVVQRLVGDLPGGPLWSVAVFVIGTAVVIGLEGLIVAIQILRLEYYEFFTKFFRGEGVPYRPFRLE